MGGVVAQDLDAFRRIAGDDRDRSVMVDQGRQIARPAVDLDRDRGPGEAGTDRRGELGPGHWAREFAAAAVGQGHDNGRRRARPLGRPRGRRSVVGVHRVTCAPSIVPSGRGEMVTKKPRPLPAGSLGFVLCLSKSARATSRHPARVVVVVASDQIDAAHIANIASGPRRVKIAATPPSRTSIGTGQSILVVEQGIVIQRSIIRAKTCRTVAADCQQAIRQAAPQFSLDGLIARSGRGIGHRFQPSSMRRSTFVPVE